MKSTLLAAALCTAIVCSTPAHAQTDTAFTYQGQLQDSGTPANGTYDFHLQLFDTMVGGLQIGHTLRFDNVIVTDGIFQVDPDFGDVFESTTPYLFIQVRDGDSKGPYTGLTPRTAILAAPKAQHATTADSVLNTQWTQTPTQINYGDGSQRVFVNRSAPITPTEYFGVHANIPGFVGMYTSGPAGSSPFYGYSVDGAISAYTYFGSSDNSWNLVKGPVVALTVDDSANLHIANNAHADNFKYNAPKTNYISVAGDAFHSGSSDPFIGSGGTGGAFISTPGSGWLAAPVQLPHGATVTRMRVYLNDIAAGTMILSLRSSTHGDISFSTIALIDSNGSSGIGLELIDSIINLPVVDNNMSSYYFRAFSPTGQATSPYKLIASS